jgi:hypothetical protein
MPIMTAHGQSDARIAARLLASTAVDCLRNPTAAAEREVALNNVYRLLEAYKLNPFFGLEAPAKAKSTAGEALALTQPMERYVSEVSSAIAQAISTAFGGTSKQEAIDEVENVLRGIAYPQKYANPTQQQLNRATQFFQEVLSRLKFV